MAVTHQDQSVLIKLVIGMLGIAPGHTYLPVVTRVFEDLDKSLPDTAAALAVLPQFNALYPTGMSSGAFADKFVGWMGLQANAAALRVVTDMFDNGVAPAQIILQAVLAIDSSNAPEYAAARALLNNRAEIAEYHAQLLGRTETDFAVLRQVLGNVTADPASVAAAQIALNAPAAPATPPEKNVLIKLVIGMLGIAPGHSYLPVVTQVFEDLDKSLADTAAALAALPQFNALYPAGMSSADFAAKFVGWMGLQSNAAALRLVTDMFDNGVAPAQIILQAVLAIDGSNAPEYAAARALLNNRAEIAEYHAQVLGRTETDFALLHQVLANITADPASVAAAQIALNPPPPPPAPAPAPTPQEPPVASPPPAPVAQTSTLTSGTDNFTAGAGDDIFNSTVVGANNVGTTLQSGDSLAGGIGTDTLNISVSGAIAAGPATTEINGVRLTGIEKVAVRNFNTAATGGIAAVTVDAAQFDASLTTLALSASAAMAQLGNTAFINVAKIVDAEMGNGGGGLRIDYNGLLVAGGADSMKLTLSNQTGSGIFKADGIETLNAVSNTGANTVALAGSTLTTINVSGTADLNLGSLAATVTTVNATGFTGGLSLDVGAGVGYSILGGSGNDVVTVGAAALAAANAINGGSGNDTLQIGTAGTGTLAATLTGFENIVLGSDTGAYDLTTVDANVAAGATLAVNGAVLTSGIHALTFNGAAELDGKFSVTGGAGNDHLTGGAQADSLIGGAGNDTFIGGLGADTLTGGAGADLFIYSTAAQSGGSAIDTITDFATTQDKLRFTFDYSALVARVDVNATQVANLAALSGKQGEFFYDAVAGQLSLNANSDTLIDNQDYQIKTATISNGDLNFALTGSAFADTIVAGDGDDTLTGGAGADSLNGGGGNDTFLVTALSDFTTGVETIVGGSGTDTIAFHTVANAPVTLSAANLGAISGIERLLLNSGSGASSVTLTDAVYVANGQGLSIIDADTTQGQLTVDGSALGAGNAIAVTANTASGVDDTLRGGAGDDSFTFAGANGLQASDTVSGGAGNDTIFLTASADVTAVLAGVSGVENITTVGSGGNISISVGSDAVIAAGGRLTVSAASSVGSNTFVYNGELINAGNKTQVITGSSGADIITGGRGNDTIMGGAGNDSLLGGDGSDHITSGEGADTIVGGGGADTIMLTPDASRDVVAYRLTSTLALEGGDTISGFAMSGGRDILSFANGALSHNTAHTYENLTAINAIVGADSVVVSLGGYNFTSTADLSQNANTLAILGALDTRSIGGGDRVVFLLDNGSNTYMWLYSESTGGGVVDTGELTLLATLIGIADAGSFSSQSSTIGTLASASSSDFFSIG
ncbi:MAG: hypothetical protein RR311_04665 [Comamonas sp.]